MELHQRHTDALFATKSLDALVFLIDAGRELEFTFGGQAYFLSGCDTGGYICLYCGAHVQRFDTMQELIRNAVLLDQPFSQAWYQAELQYLF